MRRWLPAAVAVLIAALCAPTPAFPFGKNKIAYERFDWRVYKAPHFDVYYYPEEEALLDQVVSYAESQYVRLSQILDHEIKFRIPLIYYKTHVEFEQTNIILDFIPEGVGAFAEPIENRMVVPVDLPPDKLYKLIGHELTHVFEYSILYQESMSRAFRANVPTWLMEGLASYLGQDEDNIDRMVIRDAVVHGFIPPIHRLDVLNFLTYRYGAAAFRFIEERYGTEGVRSFLWELRKSLLNNSIAKPIRDAFGVEALEFDRQFKKYLQKKYLPILLDKKEPEDYGAQIAQRDRRPEYEEEHVTFSPALSPSGELIAVLTTRWEDLDVAIISAKDGKVFRNLTKGFTNKYEYPVYGAFSGKKDLTWSPEGDRVAFLARHENERILMIYSALRGKLVRTLSIPEVDDELSPAWSPDGQWIALEGNRAGQVDIFAINLDTGETRNLTQDEYYDGNPAWSPDGTQILYNRRINESEKIFMVDVADPSRKIQLTFGESSDLQPAFARDAKTVYYTSDAEGGIFNLHSLDLETGTIRRHTDVIGGVFTPLELPEEAGKKSIVFTSYGRGMFRLFRMTPGEPEGIVDPADQARAPAELRPFEPPLRLTLDEAAKSSYDKLKWHVSSAPQVLVGVADDGTVLSNAQIVVSDLLGDHRMFFDFQSVSRFSNFNFAYLNLKNRWNWSTYFSDFRDYFLFGASTLGSSRRVRQETRVTGAGAQISYPISRFYRIGASASYYQRSLNRPFLDPVFGLQFQSSEENFPLLSWSVNGDTVRYRQFGALHGQRFEIGQQWAPTVSGSVSGFGDYDGAFVNSYVDYRVYRKATSRSLFAARVAGIVSNGSTFYTYSLGGLNQLRGYDFREFFGSRVAYLNLEYRFPLVDALAFPIGVIRDIRGFFFFDVGAAWFGGKGFVHPELGSTLSDQNILNDPKFYQANRTFDFWDSKNGKLGDGRAAYGFGWGFYLGPFQLTWSFARQLENTVEICDTSGDGDCDFEDFKRVDDPFHDSGTISTFYISREF